MRARHRWFYTKCVLLGIVWVSLRFRLYPSLKQEANLLRALESCRHLWNNALAHRQYRWQAERRATSYLFQQAALTHERHLNPELGALNAQVAQDVLHRLDKAFQAFFKHLIEVPKIQEILELWLAHLSAGLQRLSEAESAWNEVIPRKDRQYSGHLSPTTSKLVPAEDVRQSSENGMVSGSHPWSSRRSCLLQNLDITICDPM